MTQGKWALVDNDDFEWLNQWNWYIDNGYATREERWEGKKHKIIMHREILRAGKDQLVDHINGNRQDNRRENLRIASSTINSRNRLLSACNKSGHNGVFYVKRVGMYEAYITVSHKRIYLGIFKDIKKAIKIRKKGEKKYWGYTTEDLRCA